MSQDSCNKKPFIYNIIKFFIIVIIGIVLLKFVYENSSLFYQKSIQLPLALRLNERDLYLIKGEEFRLYVYSLNKRVAFYSTNFRVADVNFNGRVYGYQTGKAFIIAEVDHKELKCRVHVIDINKKTLRLKKGDTYHLKIKGTHSYVRWKSGDVRVATVNLFGHVKAIEKGKTVIVAKVKGKILTCNIIVED
jgi:hypothetical protein